MLHIISVKPPHRHYFPNKQSETKQLPKSQYVKGRLHIRKDEHPQRFLGAASIDARLLYDGVLILVVPFLYQP